MARRARPRPSAAGEDAEQATTVRSVPSCEGWYGRPRYRRLCHIELSLWARAGLGPGWGRGSGPRGQGAA
ncbi:hypothetical protein TPA0598_02_04040 [Streptomyces lydicamycinicus]|uniref:Uncharacterized protein n=1 Tax=Streptomyces lydicamycinicus TaxID=1546107 RepID=A0A0P4R2P1_9ACTN|nr:hypothetical protein TPA0598_02_04040 [Streptomyces lydicamycinicus]